jgi:hypothetical protein
VDVAAGWQKYQQDAAELFRALGFDAVVEETLVGARATHDVDVVVRFALAGVPVLWIVECKLWKASVRKEQVMTLAQIAQDVGADRAFLLSESGFQAGAVTAVRHTNVTLSNLQELTEAAEAEIHARILKDLLAEKSRLEQQIRAHLFDAEGELPPVVAADLDEVTTLLGACLDMGLAINKAQVSNFPIRLSGLVGDQAQAFTRLPDLTAALQRIAAEIRGRAERLDGAAHACRTELLEQLGRLADEVDSLLRLGGEAFAVDAGDPRREERVVLCLASMRTVGAVSEAVRTRFRGALHVRHRALMRCLIDGVYLALSIPDTDLAKWTPLAGTARDQAQALRAAAASERRGAAGSGAEA